MQELEKLVTQLDLAATFLSEGAPIKDRLALILVDNVVELLMHTRCTSDSHDWLIQHGHAPERERKLRVALGEKFVPKVAYLRSIGTVTDDERLFLTCAHRLRNEAYHAGVMHDDVLHPIAWTYHGVACGLLAKLHLRTIMHRWGEPIPAVLARHAPHCDELGGLVSTESLSRLGSSLAAARGDLRQRMAYSLSTALLARIGELVDAVSYMAKGSNFASSLDNFLRFLQMWSGRENKTIVDSARLGRWQERASEITFTSSLDAPGRTLQRYMDLTSEMHPFEQDVETAVSTHDSMVDALIDDR